MKHAPPKWADKFLQWYCRADLLEEIQGDVYELYYRTVSKSKRLADLQFVWNTFRFFRLKNIRKRKNYSSSSSAMLKSYFISGVRNISRNSTHSLINIAGLSLAIACCISVFLLVDSFYNLDNFHAKGDRIYLLTSKVKSGDETNNWARSPYLLGPALKEGHESIESMVRIQQVNDLSVRYQDHVFNESIWSVDPSFFDVFSYPVVNGPAHPLTDKKNIVISKAKASQYFGTADPVGKELSLKFSDNTLAVFQVSAVVDNMADQSSMRFGFLISMEYWEDQRNEISWATWARSTFVVTKEGSDLSALSSSLLPFQKLQNEANQKFQVQATEWIPITEVAARSYDIVDCLSWDIHPATIFVISTIVLFLLLLACFNYMNVAIASVSLRLKEIGVRKVIGGSRSQVTIQYMIENLVLCSLALIAGTALAYFFMVPAFNSLYPSIMPLGFSSISTMIYFFGGILLFIILLSGAYPSFYISSFNAIRILKGKEKFGQRSIFSKAMLGFQFAISFITIIFSLLSVTSRDYFEKKDWGYDHKDVYYVTISNKDHYLALRNLLAQQKNVVSYAGSESHVGDDDELTSIESEGKEIQVNRFPVGYGYLETMNIRLKEGRFFNASTGADELSTVVVNEALAKKMGWADPIGQTLTFNGDTYNVIGVAYDFFYEDFDKVLEPAIIHITPEENFNYFIVRSTPGSVDELAALIQRSWPTIAPDDAYMGYDQAEVFGSFYRDNKSDSKIMYFVSVVALTLACMGLYGLVSYNLSRRLKEFSIRKVFGADTLHIFRLMSFEYAVVIASAFVIGASLGYYLIKQLHQSVYTEAVPITLWPLAVTLLLMIFSVAITILSQLRRVVKENPVITLKNE